MRLCWDSLVRNGLLRAAVLVCVVFAVYGNSLRAPFAYDDSNNILENTRIQAFTPLWGPLFTESGRGVSGRPVAALSFALNYALGGTDPRGYHLANVLIHAAVAVVLCQFVLLLLSTGRVREQYTRAAPWLAFWTALVWCVHPLTTQAVTYISQRLESQGALFFLLCVFCGVKGADARRSTAWQLGAILAYLLGAGTKESIGVAPVIIFFCDCMLRGKRPVAAFSEARLLYGGLCVAMLAHGVHIFYGGQLDAGVRVASLSLPRYVFTQGEVVLHYFRLAFWPAPLVLDYGWPGASLRQGLAPFALAASLAGATAFWALRRKLRSVPLVWIFLTLAPTCLAPMVDPAVEYRMYLPLMGVVFLVVLGCWRGLQLLEGRAWHSRARALVLLLGMAAVVALGAASARRNLVYQDNLALWRDTMDKRPANARAYVNYGVTLQHRGNYTESFTYFLRALEIEPGYAKAALYAGISLVKQGNSRDALLFLDLAKKSSVPAYRAQAHEAAAKAYADLGEPEAAMRELRQAVE